MKTPRSLQTQRGNKIKGNLKRKIKVKKKLRLLILQIKKVMTNIAIIMIRMVTLKRNIGNFIQNYVHTRIRVRKIRMLWSINVRILREVQILMTSFIVQQLRRLEKIKILKNKGFTYSTSRFKSRR